MESCTIEIHRDGAWQEAAKVIRVGEPSQGFRAATRLAYESQYAQKNLNGRGKIALSCLYPVDLSVKNISTWPSFLLDMIPAGAAKTFWLKRWQIKDDLGAS